VRAAPCERGSCRTAIEQDGGEPGGGPIPWRPRWAGLRQTRAHLGHDSVSMRATPSPRTRSPAWP